MLYIQRIDPLSNILGKKYITFVGAGGKTTLIEYIAVRAAQGGKRVAITTTTKISAKDPYIVIGKKDLRTIQGTPFLRIGKTLEDGKLTGISSEEIIGLGEIFDLVLIEADGAKGRPLKYPAEYEPVVPPCSETIFVMAGLDGLYGTIREMVFRWELFCDRTGIGADEIIGPEVLLRFFSDDILLKSVNKKICTIVLNKFDALTLRSDARTFANELLNAMPEGRVIISSILSGIFYKIQKT